MRLRHRLGLSSCVAGLLAFGAAPEHARAAPDASANAGTNANAGPQTPGPEIVTVTATKVKQDVRKVPISITVVSSKQLQEQHVVTIAELTRAVPNLSFSSAGGEGNQTLEIRGISSVAGESTVAVYLDDVPLTVRNLDTEGQAEPRFFDISRIEVLRGPQGTVFGASSEGGTIRYISTPADMYNFHGSIYGDSSGTKDGGFNHQEYGTANIPIVKGKVALRLGIEQFSDGGYIDRYNPDNINDLVKRNVNGDHGELIRASLVIKPTDDLTLTPALLYQDVRTNDLSVVDLGLGLPQFLGEAKRVQEQEDDKLFIPSLTANYDVGIGDLTSVTSYYYRQFSRTVDGTSYNSGFLGSDYLDGASPPVLGLNGQLEGTAIGDLPSPVYYQTSTKQLTEEVRLASKPYAKGRFPLTWLGGLYYSQQQISEYDDEYIPGFNSTVTNLYGAGTLNQVFGGPIAQDDVYFAHRFYDERQYAVFGDATYNITSALRFSAGLRFVHARIAMRRLAGGFINGGTDFSNTDSYGDATTPRFSLSYDLTHTSTLYATISKGFRLGGPNQVIPTSTCGGDLTKIGLKNGPLTYGPDHIWNYETGVKSSLLDNKLQVTADVFYIAWTGIQQQIVLPTCGFGFDTNVGNATSFGAEGDIRYRPIPSVTFGIAAGYTHATLDQGSAVINAQKGQAVEGVPDWNATASIGYEHTITRHTRGFVRANWNWVGRSHGTLDPTDPDYTRPAYGVLGASGGIDIGKWELSVFGTNLTNDQLVIQRPNLQSVNRGYTLQPLTIGVSAGTSF